MGTRSLTILKGDDGEEIAVMYRQYDGYLENHGTELAEFLKPFTVVNGFSSATPKPAANGMDCLAAQVIAKFKTETGNIYLMPADTRDCGEEYIYTVYKKDDTLCLRAEDTYGNGHVLFDGPVADFNTERIGHDTEPEAIDPDVPKTAEAVM